MIRVLLVDDEQPARERLRQARQLTLTYRPKGFGVADHVSRENSHRRRSQW